jgi:ADP-ribosylglycohydrolase
VDPERQRNPRFEEDLGFVIEPGGPPRYARRTGRAVRYLAVADAHEQVIGYVWANDEDDAAGVKVVRSAGPAASNEAGVWGGRLRDAKARGLTPSEALAELIRDSPFVATSHVVPGSLSQAPSIVVIDDLAGKVWTRDTVKAGATGTLYGLAIGDAMGYPTEFLDVEQIASRYGSWRALELPVSAGVARVTDDTQMALAVAEALAEVTRDGTSSFTADTVEPSLRAHFVTWLRSPDNNRAPGQTCLTACTALQRDIPWQDASVLGSKGCGANMRVAPVGLVPGLSAEQRAGAAQLQAALTHGHPTALAASDLTAQAVWLLTHNCAPAELLPWLRHYALTSRETYRSDWLGDLARRAGAEDPSAFIAQGWDECLRALDMVAAALHAPNLEQDPCEVVGAGWIAEEALAAALYCFLLAPDEPLTAVRRGAWSSGDSDSIAALAGAFAGAWHGARAWPGEWVRSIEYYDRMRPLASLWDKGSPGTSRARGSR